MRKAGRSQAPRLSAFKTYANFYRFFTEILSTLCFDAKSAEGMVAEPVRLAARVLLAG